MPMKIFKNVRVKISYLTREMTIDRNTIVTLHKKGHSNSTIARSYIFLARFFHLAKICTVFASETACETVCKVVKKFN